MHVIENRWYLVLSSAQLSTRPRAVRRFGLDLVFWRNQRGQPAVALDRCPHRRTRLSLGRVKDGQLECPFHGFRFDGSGACTKIPAHPERRIPRSMHLDSLVAREEHGFIWLWTGPEAAPRSDVPFFDFSGYSHDGSEFLEPVATHYTRAIENQLDFAHLPFVHRTTIGFRSPQRFDVSTEAEGDRIVASAAQARVEFMGPNIWRMPVGDQWQLLGFAPVDDGNMVYYVRTYQRSVRWKPLAWLLGKLNVWLGRKVLRQDSPVVEAQPAMESQLRAGEQLVPSDGPIVAYRRWRERHRSQEPRLPLLAHPPSCVKQGQQATPEATELVALRRAMQQPAARPARFS